MSAIVNSSEGTNEELRKAILAHEAQLAESLRESKEQYRKIVKAGISQWIKDFQRGMIEFKTVDDLKKLIELDLELQQDDIE